MRPALATALVAALALLAACGDDEGDTTVINTTTVIEGSDGGATSTTADETDDSDADPDDGDDLVDPDDDEPALALKEFRSPTGNIACVLSAKSVRCDIAEKTWTATRPAGCPKEVDFGQGLTMGASGPAEVVCAGDTVLNPDAVVLEYGQTSRIGSIGCESDEEGMDCSNGAGGEFTLSRESYELD